MDLEPNPRPPRPPFEPANGAMPRAAADGWRAEFVRNPRARRYLLRVTQDGVARVTIPRGGSQKHAAEFLLRNRAWILAQLEKRIRARRHSGWEPGGTILFRGEPVVLAVANDPVKGLSKATFADQTVPLPSGPDDLAERVQLHLWRLAALELPPRVAQLSSLCEARPRRVAVRNQRSRWGSCSARGTVSLNWRLIQTPDSVRDYIIIHELCHLVEMNHSRRFWRRVEAACPLYSEAEAWLKKHSYLLHR